MVFSSLVFISIFLPSVFLLHSLVKPIVAKNIVLIIVSLVFYSYGEPIYVLLMIASSMLNWLCAYMIGRSRTPKQWLIVGITLNLALLGVFKYASMIVATVQPLLGENHLIPSIALPIGISFYTFQAMSYVIDVYRGDVPAAKNPLDVMLYISFFPQLIAGPIVRYDHIKEQISNRCVTVVGVGLGLRRFVIGLSKKVIIADTCASVVDPVFSAPAGQVDAAAAWLAAICYALQIYFDFSGYSDMAIGMARMFGFNFRENFTYPYAARSVQDFWRRWHISLSSWFREYLYIPLGGNRKGTPRTILNKFIVFFLCGLWHGAAWTFAVWGLIHGLFLMLEQIVPIRKLPRFLGHLYTMAVVILAFVVFRAESFSQAKLMFARMFLFGANSDTQGEPGALALSLLEPYTIFIIAVGVIAMLPVTRFLNRVPTLARTLGVTNPPTSHAPAAVSPSIWSYSLALLLLVIDVLMLSAGGYHPFIYFRF